MIDTKLRLRIGAVLHFIIAAGHLACLFFLDEAFRAFNILEEMTQLSFGLAWLPYAITVAAVSFVTYIVAGFVQNAIICLVIGAVLTVGTLFVIRSVESKKAA